MVPASMAGVITFLLLVAPGICYELLRQRTRQPRGESTFVEISRVLLVGTVLSAVAVGVLALIHFASARSLLNLDDLLTNGTGYVIKHTSLTFWSIGAELFLAVLLAIAANDLLTPQTAQPIVPANIWHVPFERLTPSGHEVHLSVRLKNGTDIVGRWIASSTEPDPTERELLLLAPISVRKDGEATAVQLAETWQCMVLSGSEIANISVSYSPSATPAASPNRIDKTRSFLSQHWLRWPVASVAIAVLVVFAVLFGWLH